MEVTLAIRKPYNRKGKKYRKWKKDISRLERDLIRSTFDFKKLNRVITKEQREKVCEYIKRRQGL